MASLGTGARKNNQEENIELVSPDVRTAPAVWRQAVFNDCAKNAMVRSQASLAAAAS